jgi:hypothetical protein
MRLAQMRVLWTLFYIVCGIAFPIYRINLREIQVRYADYGWKPFSDANYGNIFLPLLLK